MAKIKDFLEQLAPGTYTDQQLRDQGGTGQGGFGLSEDQLAAVVSHDSKKIRKAIKDDDGEDVKGQLLRVVM